MDTVGAEDLSRRLGAVLTQVCRSHEPVIVTGGDAGDVVMISLNDFEALNETGLLLRDAGNAERLARSIAQAERGELTERPLPV